MIFGMV